MKRTERAKKSTTSRMQEKVTVQYPFPQHLPQRYKTKSFFRGLLTCQEQNQFTTVMTFYQVWGTKVNSEYGNQFRPKKKFCVVVVVVFARESSNAVYTTNI